MKYLLAFSASLICFNCQAQKEFWIAADFSSCFDLFRLKQSENILNKPFVQNYAPGIKFGTRLSGRLSLESGARFKTGTVNLGEKNLEEGYSHYSHSYMRTLQVPLVVRYKPFANQKQLKWYLYGGLTTAFFRQYNFSGIASTLLEDGSRLVFQEHLPSRPEKIHASPMFTLGSGIDFPVLKRLRSECGFEFNQGIKTIHGENLVIQGTDGRRRPLGQTLSRGSYTRFYLGFKIPFFFGNKKPAGSQTDPWPRSKRA